MDSSIEIPFAGEKFLADTRRALYWPARETLIVADLHIGKAQDYTPRGTFLPPYEVQDICQRLEKLIVDYKPQRVVALGDSFHRPHSLEHLQPEERACLDALVHSVKSWLFIEGNHDAGLSGSNWKLIASQREKSFTLRHQPGNDSLQQIVGHFHPKYKRVFNMRNCMIKPCFAWDEQLLILPAFGTYTGGLDVEGEAIGSLFEKEYSIATAETYPKPAVFSINKRCAVRRA